MSKKYHFNNYNMRGGSQCMGNLAVNATCMQSVDVGQYKTPCNSLPLDSNFTQKGGSQCSQSVDVSQYKTPCNSLPLDSNFTQKGGSPYKLIVNPKTGRKVSITGIIGQRVLHKYLSDIVDTSPYIDIIHLS